MRLNVLRHAIIHSAIYCNKNTTLRYLNKTFAHTARRIEENFAQMNRKRRTNDGTGAFESFAVQRDRRRAHCVERAVGNHRHSLVGLLAQRGGKLGTERFETKVKPRIFLAMLFES